MTWLSAVLSALVRVYEHVHVRCFGSRLEVSVDFSELENLPEGPGPSTNE
jgi:hypothetical protein